jgi:hypothetical protein
MSDHDGVEQVITMVWRAQLPRIADSVLGSLSILPRAVVYKRAETGRRTARLSNPTLAIGPPQSQY